MWKAYGGAYKGWLLAMSGQASDAVKTLTSAIDEHRNMRSTLLATWSLVQLAKAYADLGQFKDVWRHVDEALSAIETSNERWQEAEVNRVAGEVALKSPQPYRAKAKTFFERALWVARQQQAKSWELRAAMSMARLWRDQGKRLEARDLLAPVYGWFTEGFDTLDLREAKALLEQITLL
jgi:predicted ATPase